MEQSLGRHKVLKSIRWALLLSAFNYRIEHVPGDSNIRPYLMTRWMRKYRKISYLRRLIAELPFNGVNIPPDAPDFEWPTASEIRSAQANHQSEATHNSREDYSGIIIMNVASWVPPDCTDQNIRLLPAAHGGNAGNRDSDPIWYAIFELFTWNELLDDIRSLFASYLLCVLYKSGSKFPRQLSSTINETKQNEVIHFGCHFLGEGADDYQYVLVIKDDLSGYCWIDPTTSADAENAATDRTRPVELRIHYNQRLGFGSRFTFQESSLETDCYDPLHKSQLYSRLLSMVQRIVRVTNAVHPLQKDP